MDKISQIYIETIINNNQIDQNFKGAILGSLLAASTIGPMVSNAEGKNFKMTENIPQDKNKEYAINYAIKLIQFFEGSIKDKNDFHIVYDDLNNKLTWDPEKQSFESFKKKCKGTPTIGYGQTSLNLVKNGKLTEKQATDALRIRINQIYRKLQQTIQQKNFNDLSIGKKAALLSLYYNFGTNFKKTPKLITAIINKDYKQAAKQFLDCNKTTINGRKIQLAGLTKRRQIQSNIFLKNS